jgi:hypothetical protein
MNSVQSNLPKFQVQFNQLPSRGLGYPEGATIYYRGYTAGEINKISAVRQEALTYEFMLRAALEGIEVLNMDKMKLSYIDVLSIGLRRRVSSEGDLSFKMPYQCSKCDNVSTLKFDHSDIKFDTISEKVKIDDVEHDLKLPITVIVKEKELKFWYPTVESVLSAFAKKGVDHVTAVKALCVQDSDFKEVYDLLFNLNEQTDFDDLEALDLVDKALYHNIAPINSVCTNKVESEGGQFVQCGHTNQVSIEGKELLIRPFRETKRPIGNKVRFGN